MAQQWLLKEALGLGPLQEGERDAVAPRRTRAQVWAANVAAARQYQEREGHLEVPHRHVKKVGEDEQALGVFIANSRSRSGAAGARAGRGAARAGHALGVMPDGQGVGHALLADTELPKRARQRGDGALGRGARAGAARCQGRGVHCAGYVRSDRSTHGKLCADPYLFCAVISSLYARPIRNLSYLQTNWHSVRARQWF
ncbi:helicase associated domain-containing protein [Streptomyces vietnamensis]|uniref:helicase associated domain-containing protein n=1 Tax=Streptomyces vietnamensis TaxID=362257 RepID=UPI0034464EE8